MKKIKAAVSPSGGGLRIPIAVVLGGTITTTVAIVAKKILEFCEVPAESVANAEKLFMAIGVPLALVLIAMYIFRTLRRRYAYGYMENYFSELRDNGFNTCPRCGSPVNEHTGTRSRQVHVADRITTTTYSDGSTSKKTDAVYQSQSYKYIYHKCSNPACALNDDIEFSFGDMPYKLRDLRVLILGERHPKVYNAAATIDPGKRIVRFILIGLLIVAILIGLFAYRGNMRGAYGAFGGAEVDDINVSATFGEEETKMMSDIRKIINDTKEYGLYVSEVGTGLFAKDKDLDIYYFVDDKLGNGFTVEFEGIKSDSGLKGDYTIMPYNGENCIFNDDDKTIYPPDSDFYKTHYESIAKWGGKKIITDLLDKITTGELYENYTDMYVLCSDNIRIFIAEDGSVRLLDETGEKAVRYIFEPQDTSKPEDYADYKLLGAKEEEPADELGKVLKKIDFDADIEWVKDGEDAGEIEVENNGDGTYTFENSYNPIDKLELGRFVLYPDEKRYEYFAYDPDKYIYSETSEKHTAQSDPTVYNFLVEMIPEDYVRAHINLDNAKKQSLLGISTVYTEDLGNGKKAVLEIQAGDVGFEYYESEDTYIEISW